MKIFISGGFRILLHVTKTLSKIINSSWEMWQYIGCEVVHKKRSNQLHLHFYSPALHFMYFVYLGKWKLSVPANWILLIFSLSYLLYKHIPLEMGNSLPHFKLLIPSINLLTFYGKESLLLILRSVAGYHTW